MRHTGPSANLSLGGGARWNISKTMLEMNEAGCSFVMCLGGGGGRHRREIVLFYFARGDDVL